MQQLPSKRLRKAVLFFVLLCASLTGVYAQQQKGKASYYSRRAHGARTSSGIRLHNDSLFCAHRTYPFGTLLLVRNPLNGKEVVVKVVDRGPFSRGRILDLSYEAARQLGMLSAGVVVVEVSKYEGAKVPFKNTEPAVPELDIELPVEASPNTPIWQKQPPETAEKKEAADQKETKQNK